MLQDDQIALMRVYEIEYFNKPSILLKPFNNKKTCVVIIDMVNGFCSKGALASPLCGAIVPKIATVLDFLPNADKVFVNDRHTQDSEELKTFPAHCHTDRESSVVQELLPYADRIIYKNSTNGLFSFAESVRERYENYIVMGCCTDICVLQFCLALKAMLNEDNVPSNVLTFTDYNATYDSDAHNAVLESVFAYRLMDTAGIKIFKRLTQN